MEFQDECHECGYSKFKEYELEKHLALYAKECTNCKFVALFRK